MPRADDSRHGVIGLMPLLALAKERGLDGPELLRSVGIATKLLDDPQAAVPADRVHALVHQLLRRTGDEALGLQAARHYHPATFGLLGAVAAVTPTVREVVRLFVEYTHLTYTFFLLEFEESESEGRLTFVDNGDLGPLHRFYLDRELAFVQEIGRAFWPDNFRSVAGGVELDYPEPPEADRYRKFFPCPVRFGAPRATFIVDLAADRPRSDPNPLALGQLKDHLREFAGARKEGDDLLDGVRREISVAIANRRELPGADKVATRLGLTERTLRRRLEAQGTSFRALAEEVIAPLAKRYLRESALTIADVAERLGYSEPASFVRAFRRWTGTTPEAYRQARDDAAS
jgi:AraC-like DNA-binding protein